MRNRRLVRSLALVAAWLAVSVLLGIAPVALSAPPSGIWANLGPNGGEINSVAVDPSSPATLWAGTINGVFKSMDRGEHWTQMSVSNSYGIAVHPSNGSIAFVCDQYRQVYRTADRGASWVLSSGGLAPGYSNGGRIRIKPDDPAVMLYGSASNIFRSTDSGLSWTLSEAGLPASKSVSEMLFDPSNPQNVFLSLGQLGIYKSTNGGSSWSLSSAGLPTRVSGVNTYYDVGSFSVDPSNGQHLFAWRSRDSLFYASTDGGGSWTLRSAAPLRVRNFAVAPESSQTLYAAGLDDAVGSSTFLGRIYRSRDAGATWASTSDSIWSSFGGSAVMATSPGSPAAVYVTLGGSVMKSMNGGDSWTPAVNGLLASQCDHFAFAPGQPSTWYVHASSNGIFKTTDAGATMTPMNNGLVEPGNGAMVVDPLNPQVLLAEGGGVEAMTFDGLYYPYLVRSTDGGATWNEIANNDFVNYPDLQAWGLVAVPTTPTTFFVAAPGDGVYKSTDSGVSFVPMNTGLPPADTFHVSYLDIATSDASGTTLFLAAGSNGLYKSANGGGTWALSGSGMSVSEYIRQIAVSSSVPQRVFAASNSGLYRSTDGGGTWNLTGGLPSGSVMTVALDPSNPSTVLVSGSTPSPWVSRSTDAGNSWTSLPTTGLGLSGIWRVALDPANPNRILAAGRGGLSALILDPNDPFGKGVPSTTEDLAPSLGGSGTGDGNGDGTQDSTQRNVASLPLVTGGGWVTIEGQNGTTLNGVQAITNPSPGDLPAGATLPMGMMQFVVSGISVEACTTVTLYYPKNASITNYYKYGPTPDNITPHWYDFADDGTTGAQIFQDATRTRIVLHMCDGLRGDGDIIKNGFIRDPGGPIVMAGLFYPLPPCRVLDTRNPTGPLGAPALQADATRTFNPVASACGVPAGAVAISANLTVTNVGALGELVMFPADVLQPNTSALSFRAGRTRANNSIVSLANGSTTFSVFNNSPATVDFILDVNGYFQ